MTAPITTMPSVQRCPETRAHYAHEWYNPLRIQCPGGPDETPESPSIGHVQNARWGEWEAVCNAPRCGWRSSKGNRTQGDAEKRMRGHAATCHPPTIPVRTEGA